MVEWSIAAFRACPSVGAVVVACPPGHAHELDGEGVELVDGGETRARSVANALAAVGTELVAVHDAARPLVTPELIEAAIETLVADPEAAGAIAAAPITDTVKRASATRPGTSAALDASVTSSAAFVTEETVDRERLWAAQTPQVFRADRLREALAAGSERIDAATDEAMLVEMAGGKVLIHPAPAENIKVTTPLDLKLAELLLGERSTQ